MTPKKINYQHTADTIIKNLAKRQMKGYYCETKEDALKLALSLMPEGSSISWGGSMTLFECGLMDAIKNASYDIIDRDTATTPEEIREMSGRICTSDFFLMSTNAITMEGELVNVDGRANRVSFLCYGPQNVIIIAGMNKVTLDVEEGLKRARNTPCAVTGKCGNCLSPDCICSQIVVTRRSHIPDRIKVILVGEELGF